MSDILKALQRTLESRKSAEPDSSYVASLYTKGLNKILEKVGEEATEVILAAKDFDCSDELSRKNLLGEVADLWFHSMVMLAHLDLTEAEVIAILADRLGVSGFEEKASRANGVSPVL